MSLIAAADSFVGTTSGGSHVAAAFDVPGLIVAARSLLVDLQFPVSGLGVVAAFLYPQHWFIAAEEVTPERFAERHVRQLLRDMEGRGRAGRQTAIGNHARNPCGFRPAKPHRAIKLGNRLVSARGISG
jgi:hypothetical protein